MKMKIALLHTCSPYPNVVQRILRQIVFGRADSKFMWCFFITRRIFCAHLTRMSSLSWNCCTFFTGVAFRATAFGVGGPWMDFTGLLSSCASSPCSFWRRL